MGRRHFLKSGAGLSVLAAAATFILAASPLTAQRLKTSVTWERLNANAAPLEEIGTLVPRLSDGTGNSWWSVGCETLDRDYAVFANFKQYVGETGVGYARLQSGWAKTEQEKGKYEFEWLDEHVNGLLEQGVKPWICLCYGNPIYSDHGLNLNAKIFPDGPIMDAWEKYVAKIVKRYKGKVTMYEVWNEPDGGENGESFDAYANLFVHTAKIIRKYDKNVKIAALGVCSPDKEYIRKSIRKVKELGGIDYVDYVTFHGYWKNPDDLAPAVRKLREDMKEISPKIEILQGESGCPGQLEYGHALNGIELDEYKQVKWDLRHMATNFDLGVPSSVFTMVDLNYGWMLQSFGLIRMNLISQPQYKRPKFYGVRNMCSVVTRDFSPCAPDELKVSSSCGHKIKAVGLKKDGKVVGCMLYFCEEMPTSSLERTNVALTVDGAALQDPVYVDMVTGKVHNLGGNFLCDKDNGRMEFYRLPLWDAPVLIVNRAEINFE